MFKKSCSWMAMPSVTYKSLVAQGTIRHDQKQDSAMRHVDRVYSDVQNFYGSNTLNRNPRPLNSILLNKSSGSSSSSSSSTPMSFFKSATTSSSSGAKKDAAVDLTVHPLSDVKGLYLFGGVGCGKTYMMDLLYNELPTSKKRRVHFHGFMLDVHKKMHDTRAKHRTTDPSQEVDIVHECALSLIRDIEVLCFDEIVVSDIADAMIVRRLFNCFFKIGVCVIFTSNRHPDELYKGGMNRDSFTPFIKMIKDRCSIYDMNSSTDYRLTGTNAKTYMFPINEENETKFSRMFSDSCKGMVPQMDILTVFGRDVYIPDAMNGVCLFTFADICGGPMSPADYGVIAQKYHTVFIKHVPQFSISDGDNRRRFIHMLDTFYQYKVKIVVLATAAPAGLQKTREEITDPDELAMMQGSLTTEFGQIINAEEDDFQMQRCVSRLTEMMTVQYLNSKHSPREPTD